MAFLFANQNEHIFPHPSLTDSYGVLAIGGDLRPERLLLAYHFGIFPWYNAGEPILWWCPDPRFILAPAEVHISKSMNKILRQNVFRLSYDTSFEEVIRSCKEIERKNQHGTWITDEMEQAYIKLHELGYAHSIEVWNNEELVGGLYGIALGKCFFGESMFSKQSNASKYGFIRLCQDLDVRGYKLIDCQQPNPHLESLGGKFMSREDFLSILRINRSLETERGNWTFTD